jgi:UDP-N-acetylmuramoyl-tripeptide--D-alanyl-D-alanine ligase
MTRFVWTSRLVREALSLPQSGEPGREYTGVSTDSRRLRRGELFVALRGDRFDGTQFVAAAAAAGALGAVVDRRPDGVGTDFELFLVDDTLRALGRLAAVRRKALDPTVIAITGTSGKTTTRELTAAALGEAAYASPGNFNNLVGLPLSILAAPEEAGTWVLEIASNSPGEVERLSLIAEPDYALITSLSEGHLEGLSDLKGVLNEKLGLLSGLRAGGCALVADQPADLARGARERCSDVRTVGLSSSADEHPDRWSASEQGVEWRWRSTDFVLNGFGTHLIRNALFALAVGGLLGIDPQRMVSRLAAVKLPPMRGEVRRIGDLVVLVDCYNANPASFRAAIESLSSLAGKRRRAVLAGTMLELGGRSAALHAEIADAMITAGIELIALTGGFAAAYDERSTVRPSGELILAETLEDAYRELALKLRGDEAVLLKASRGMKFERAIPLFERDFGVLAAGRLNEREADEV